MLGFLTNLLGRTVFTGTSRGDLIHGSSRSDLVDARGGNDWVSAGAGNDTIVGGSGNDTIIGGAGSDTAVFAGSVIEYTWSRSPVSGLVGLLGGPRGATNIVGPDGRDLLFEIEVLQFDDAIIFLDGRNNAPFAGADAVRVAEDAPPVLIDVLANDFDFDVSFRPSAVSPSLTVIGHNDSMTHGKVVHDADGRFFYDPDGAFDHLREGETATDTFTYTVRDNRGATTTQVVTVTIEGRDPPNNAPTGATDFFRLKEDTVFSVEAAEGVLSNDFDPEDDALTATLMQDVEHGVLILHSDGSFSYMPDADFFGTDTFTYRVSDGRDVSDPVSVTLTVDNVGDLPPPGEILLAEIATDASSAGFRIIGEGGGNLAGYDVAAAGDVNGDGHVDLIVGAPGVSSAYVVFGGWPLQTPVDLGDIAAGIGGFKIAGLNRVGGAVSSAGDINADGFDDVAIGNPWSDAQVVNVIFGAAGFAGELPLAGLQDGNGGFRIVNQVPAFLSFSDAGDVNGDGISDLAVGVSSDHEGGVGAGAAYIVFGKQGDISDVYLQDIAAGSSRGIKIIGEDGSRAGTSVASAGDVNGDGIDDIIIGAFMKSEGGVPETGAAYVVFGSDEGLDKIYLADIAAGAGGFKIAGEEGFQWAGFSVSAAGDVNGDGIDDVVVSAAHPFGPEPLNAAYVVYGRGDGVRAQVDLDAIAAGAPELGFKIIGDPDDNDDGMSLAAAGDVNRDGIDDLILGVYYNNSGGAFDTGAAYIVFGTAEARAQVELGDVATGIGGFRIVGEGESTFAGNSVAGIGDFNRDGFDDVLVGAQGHAYVIYGGDWLM